MTGSCAGRGRPTRLAAVFFCYPPKKPNKNARRSTFSMTETMFLSGKMHYCERFYLAFLKAEKRPQKLQQQL